MKKKYLKLLISLVLDFIGYITIFPIDLVWAPLSGYIMTRMYKGTKGKVAGIISFVEEIVPFADVIPTFTILWIYTYLIKKEDKNKEIELLEN